MANQFPVALNNYLTGASSPLLSDAGHASAHNAYESKLGITNSADTTSLDWLVKKNTTIGNNTAVLNASAYSSIQAAINALPATGGMVYIPSGTYVLTTGIAVPDNVTLVGAGRSTILQMGPSFPTTITVDAQNFCSAIYNANQTTGNHGIRISALTIDANYVNRSPTAYDYVLAMTSGSTDCWIEDVYIHDSTFNAFCLILSFEQHIRNCYSYSTAGNGFTMSRCKKSDIIGCVAEKVTRSLGAGTGPDGFQISDNQDVSITDCIAFDCNYRAFACEGNSPTDAARRTVFRGCHAYFYVDTGFYLNWAEQCAIIGCTASPKGDSGFKTVFTPITGGGIGYRVAFNCLIANNVIENCYADGIHMMGDSVAGDASYGNVISGNICRNNGQRGIGTDQGIMAEGNAGTTHLNCSVIGNMCYDDQATHTQGYGITLTPTSGGSNVGWNVTGNFCTGNLRHGIFLAGIDHGICSNNQTKDNSQAGSALYDGIYLSNCHRIAINSNDSTGSLQKYGIEAVTSDNNTCVANTLTSNVTGAYSLSGAANQISLNITT